MEEKKPLIVPNPQDGPFCPELPAQVVMHPVTRAPAGYALQACIAEKCAKYLGCQVVPKLAEKYFKQGIITGPVS